MTEVTEITSPADLQHPGANRVFRSKNSRAYHYQDCPTGWEIYERNRQYYSSQEAARMVGLRPCPKCAQRLKLV